MKIPSAVLLDRANQAAADLHPADIAGLLARNGIELIAEKVETEATVVDLLDFDLKFGQGNLFSPPRPVKQEQIKADEKPDAAPEPKEKETAEKIAPVGLPQATLPASFKVSPPVAAPAAPAAAARAVAVEQLPTPDYTASELPKTEPVQSEVIHGASALARLAKIVARQKTGT
jgi:cyclic-di-GMP phosphodiesterase TipF (flagellum assembly factor)